MHGFPKPDPDIEHAQTRAQAADKTAGKNRPECGRTEQEVVVGPFRPPGKNDQQNTDYRAQKYEKQDQNPMYPY